MGQSCSVVGPGPGAMIRSPVVLTQAVLPLVWAFPFLFFCFLPFCFFTPSLLFFNHGLIKFAGLVSRSA